MPKLNRPAPDFSGLTAYHKGEFKKISLSDYKGRWLVLFFYPRDFTFVCPTELKSFAENEAAFAKLNADILAASTDSAWSHKAWFEQQLPMVTYPILADTSQALSRQYGILDEEDGTADRGLFIIDPEQKTRYILVSDGSVGRSVTETLRVLEALQTGELCPADWHKGQDTLSKG